ncbi:MAG: hypothetical protein AB1461_02140 [Thermodesulfobacteriota bacterium]
MAPRITTGPAHYNAFLADLKNRTNKFTESRSSVKNLLKYLRDTKDAPLPFASVDAAKAHCKDRNDKRLDKYEPAIRALVRVWGTGTAYQAEVARVAAPRGGDKFSKHAVTWANLTVTDLPTGEPGKYKLIQGFSDVDNVKGSAIAWTTSTTKCAANKVESQPHYWLKLGSMASKPQRSGDRKRYVRCFSCAAIAAYTLVKDHDFDDVDIAVVGAPDYDHYFVVVGDLERIKQNKFAGAQAVDLWQHNLDKKSKAVNDLDGFIYVKRGFTIFCEFPSDQRRVHAAIV